LVELVEFLNLRASSPLQMLVTSYARRSLRGFTRRQCQRHDGSLVAAHPLDLTVELSRKGIDQAAAEPGIRASLRANDGETSESRKFSLTWA